MTGSLPLVSDTLNSLVDTYDYVARDFHLSDGDQRSRSLRMIQSRLPWGQTPGGNLQLTLTEPMQVGDRGITIPAGTYTPESLLTTIHDRLGIRHDSGRDAILATYMPAPEGGWPQVAAAPEPTLPEPVLTPVASQETMAEIKRLMQASPASAGNIFSADWLVLGRDSFGALLARDGFAPPAGVAHDPTHDGVTIVASARPETVSLDPALTVNPFTGRKGGEVAMMTA